MSAAKESKAVETSNPVKVLRIVWDALQDIIFPSPKPESSHFTSARTKRVILKCTPSVFDPLGLITPVTISAKLFIQQLWQQCHEWDSDLNEQLRTEWNIIAHDILHAMGISFPRKCVTSSPNADATLHVFADASPKAYGAASYFQLISCNVKGQSSTTQATLTTEA